MVVEELYRMPDDGFRHELAGGCLVSEPLAGARHGRVAATLVRLLDGWVRERRLGVVLVGAGFVLHRAPDTVRVPDVAFVTLARYAKLEDEFLAVPGPPDLAIEVVDRCDRVADIHAKVGDHLAAGCPLVWVIDPEREEALIYRSLLRPVVLDAADELQGEGALKGFRVPVEALFEI